LVLPASLRNKNALVMSHSCRVPCYNAPQQSSMPASPNIGQPKCSRNNRRPTLMCRPGIPFVADSHPVENTIHH
jgi:hypothetical protein